MISPEKEIEILERISRSKSTIRQRDLARIIGLSLGMTNSILKRLTNKGLLKIKKVNNRNIQYVVSPAGMEAIALRSYRYFKRTLKNVVSYKEAMDELVQEIMQKGCRRLVLVGKSDLDFIVEHFCDKYRIEYRNIRGFSTDPPSEDGDFFLYSENLERPVLETENTASLRSLFVNRVEALPRSVPT
ncbi:MAG TPA: winged helix-turn-helix transcriptional regulator [archaeon]|nr:winged helix-turn-helix transcriptional regulator [archaeon]